MTEEIIDDVEVCSDSRHRSFPHINQYRNTCKLVRERAAHDGLPLPRLVFHGSVKLHGTNAGINFDENSVMLAQSRSRILTPEDDHMGFAVWVRENAQMFPRLVSSVIFGEWCGGNIQKGVALTGLPKMFVPFAVSTNGRWWSPGEMKTFFFHSGLRCIYDFPNWTRVVDFNCPELRQNELGELTQAVEAECPVGKALGVSGIGEGIVWWPEHRDDFNVEDLQFKVKGEKHSETKVKTLASVDLEKIENVRALVESIVTENRLEQKFVQSGFEPDIKKTGDFLKLVTADVMREEGDTIAASEIPLTDVMRGVSLATKAWWMQKVNGQPL